MHKVSRSKLLESRIRLDIACMLVRREEIREQHREMDNDPRVRIVRTLLFDASPLWRRSELLAMVCHEIVFLGPSVVKRKRFRMPVCALGFGGMDSVSKAAVMLWASFLIAGSLAHPVHSLSDIA